jgi:hypothetical protein
VVVWVTHYLGDWPAITGHAGGRSFTLIDGEHARLAIGYDAHGIYTLDPLEGPQYDAWDAFLRSWARFTYMGIVVGATLPLPAAPTIQAQRRPGDVTWSWTEPAGPLDSEATLFRDGRPLWRALLAPTASPGRTDVLSGTSELSGTTVLTGTVLATTPLSATTSPASVASTTGLPASPVWRAGSLALQVQLAPSVPYTLTVRIADPLGLTSPLATSPVVMAAAPTRPAATPILPPPLPAGVQAAIAGPRLVRWTWPVGPGLTYRVVSYRYLGSRPVDYVDLTLGRDGSYTRAVQPNLAYYAQVLAINGAGLSSPATPPIPAPVIAPARILGPIGGTLRHGGYGVWQWAAHGATRFIVQSYAYSGSQVVGALRARTVGTTYARRLTPGLDYHVLVWAVGNDGEQAAPVAATQGLVYHPAHTVQGLGVRRLPDGRQRWSWTPQPAMRYRLQLTRYIGRRATIVARLETATPRWASPATPPNATDYLQVWAVDACGDVSAPVQQQGISGARATA